LRNNKSPSNHTIIIIPKWLSVLTLQILVTYLHNPLLPLLVSWRDCFLPSNYSAIWGNQSVLLTLGCLGATFHQFSGRIHTMTCLICLCRFDFCPASKLVSSHKICFRWSCRLVRTFASMRTIAVHFSFFKTKLHVSFRAI